MGFSLLITFKMLLETPAVAFSSSLHLPSVKCLAAHTALSARPVLTCAGGGWAWLGGSGDLLLER